MEYQNSGPSGTLKRAPTCESVTNSNNLEENVGIENPEACANSEPSVHVEEQATQDDQNEGTITTRSGRVVKDDNFVYH